MPGTLTHSPAAVLAKVLVDLGAGVLAPTAPTASNWPIRVGQWYDSPDNSILINDSVGVIGATDSVVSEVSEFQGVQLLIRSKDYPTGYTKAQALAIVLDSGIYLTETTLGGVSYTVQQVVRRGTVNNLGADRPNSERIVFSLNAVISLRQTS